MGAASLPGVNWTQAQSMYESGLTFQKVAEFLGIGVEAVKKRAQRKDWVTPNKVKKAQEALSLKCPSTSEMVALDLNQKQEIHRQTLQKITDKMWKRVDRSPPKVESVNDLEKLQKVTRINLDMSSGETGPSVQVLFTGTETAAIRDVTGDIENVSSGTEIEE